MLRAIVRPAKNAAVEKFNLLVLSENLVRRKRHGWIVTFGWEKWRRISARESTAPPARRFPFASDALQAHQANCV